MKRVLVITYYWPPAGGPGVQRVLKFVKYLPEYGWRPSVLTVRGGEFPSLDPSLASEVPADCAVHRASEWSPGALYRRFTGQRPDAPIPVAAVARGDAGGWRHQWARWIRMNLFIPDAKIGWIPQAVAEGRRVLLDEQPDVLFSSSPPSTVHLVARRLARAGGLPWVADFRDPWTKIYSYAQSPRTAWAQALDRRLERQVVAATGWPVAINRTVAEQLAGDRSAERFAIVPNGWDEEDFSAPPEPGPGDAGFTLCYAGSLTPQQSPRELWRAVRSLADADPAFAAAFRFRHLGVLDPRVRAEIEALGLLPFCDLQGYAPHAAAIEAMRRAQALLLLIPDAPGNEAIVTGKLFEYLAAGGYVLGIGPESGEAARLLAECRAGTMRPAGAWLAEALREQFAAWRRGERWEADRTAVARYTRRRMTGELARVLAAAGGEP